MTQKTQLVSGVGGCKSQKGSTGKVKGCDIELWQKVANKFVALCYVKAWLLPAWLFVSALWFFVTFSQAVVVA